jgi:hypothetical protein
MLDLVLDYFKTEFMIEQGDSGGPIFFKSDRAQVGLTSWGLGCARYVHFTIKKVIHC